MGKINKTIKDLLLEYLGLYLECKKNNPYREIDIISRAAREIDSHSRQDDEESYEKIINGIEFQLIRINRYKSIFYETLHILLKNYLTEAHLLEQLKKLSADLVLEWDGISSRAMMFYYLEKEIKLDTEIAKVIKLEEEVHILIQDIVRTIS